MLTLSVKTNTSAKNAKAIILLSVATVCFPLLIAFLFVALCMAGGWFSYEEIMTWFNEQTRLFYKISTGGTQLLFTYKRYIISRYVSLMLLVVFTLIIILIGRFWSVVISSVNALYDAYFRLINRYFRVLKSLGNRKIVAFLIIMGLAFGFQLVQYRQFIIFLDDLWSYTCFAQNMIVTSIFYPIPNNHVFYNQLSYLLS